MDTILDMAREHLQGFAIIIVSSAEVKIVKGTTLLHSHEKLSLEVEVSGLGSTAILERVFL